MTDFDAEHVTIAGVPHGHQQADVIVRKALARHDAPSPMTEPRGMGAL